MLKKYFVITLSVLVINLCLSSVTVFAETKEEKAVKRAEKVKANVAKLGKGTDARIEVKLKDGTKIKGYVSEIKENSFVVMDAKTASPVEIPYPNAKQVKGNNLSTGAKIAIGVGIAIAVILIVSAVYYK